METGASRGQLRVVFWMELEEVGFSGMMLDRTGRSRIEWDWVGWSWMDWDRARRSMV